MTYNSTIINDQKSLKKLQQLLKANKLPSSDLKLEGSFFIGYHNAEGILIGSGGLEQYGNTGLLRSIAVDEKLRGLALGKEIVDNIIEKAKQLKIKDLYLLTETAHNYFLKKGFQDVPRDAVPDAIKQSTEFSQVCQVSATVMKLTINK